MKQYLLDISVILDLLLNRSPWAADAAVIWDAHRKGQIRALAAAFSLPGALRFAKRKPAPVPHPLSPAKPGKRGEEPVQPYPDKVFA